MFVSLLSHFWLINFFPPTSVLSTISKAFVKLNVFNHTRDSQRRHVTITACNVQVSAVDSQTVPTEATGDFYPNIYNDQWEPIVIYHSITFTGPTTMQPTLLTSWLPTTVVQGVDNHSWGLYCRRCYCTRVCWGRPSQIFHFSRWLGQLSAQF